MAGRSIAYTVCALIFAGFNVRGFRGSAAICEYFVREYLDVTVNRHVYLHNSSQSMTSCVTKMAIIGYGQPRSASSFVPEPLLLLSESMSIHRYLVPKRDIVTDLEKIVPPSMAKAVRKEVESTTHVAAAEQSGSVAMGSMKRGQYDKTITDSDRL